MKKLYYISLSLALVALSVASTKAQTVLGGFQSSSDPTDAGWSDWSSGIGITVAAPPTDTQYSFVAAGVPGYAQSLEITPSNPGYSQNLSLNLSSSQTAAFLANSYLTFTFSAPAWTSGGYTQITPLIFNTPGLGFGNPVPWSLASSEGNNGNNQSGQPTFYFYNGSPMVSQTVSLNYSSLLASRGGPMSASPSYFQMVFITESGGGAPTDFFINNVELSTSPFGVDAVPEPGTIVLGVIGASSFLLRRRK